MGASRRGRLVATRGVVAAVIGTITYLNAGTASAQSDDGDAFRIDFREAAVCVDAGEAERGSPPQAKECNDSARQVMHALSQNDPAEHLSRAEVNDRVKHLIAPEFAVEEETAARRLCLEIEGEREQDGVSAVFFRACDANDPGQAWAFWTEFNERVNGDIVRGGIAARDSTGQRVCLSANRPEPARDQILIAQPCSNFAANQSFQLRAE